MADIKEAEYHHRYQRSKLESQSKESHLTVDPFALTGALGGTNESPFVSRFQFENFEKLTFSIVRSLSVIEI